MTDLPPIPPEISEHAKLHMANGWDNVNSHLKPFLAAYFALKWEEESIRIAKTPLNDCKHFDDIKTWVSEAHQNYRAWRRIALGDDK